MESSAGDERPEALADPGVQQRHPGSTGEDTPVGLVVRMGVP